MKTWNLCDSMMGLLGNSTLCNQLTAEDKMIAFIFSRDWEGLSHLRTLKSNRKHT
jgi:hypothetical protein